MPKKLVKTLTKFNWTQLGSQNQNQWSGRGQVQYFKAFLPFQISLGLKSCSNGKKCKGQPKFASPFNVAPPDIDRKFLDHEVTWGQARTQSSDVLTSSHAMARPSLILAQSEFGVR